MIAAFLFTAVLIWAVWQKTDSSPPFVVKTLCKAIVGVKVESASGQRVLPGITDIPETRAWRNGCADYLSQPE
ncbi:hypothetical protein [Ensifer sp. 22460]|uniref:hypothetical protein n=1 Tax=Ensifer sp. 22460 TaxID=3453922 RepID=UPI003F8383F6